MVVGDDGGTERSDSGATPFRTFNLGWLVGVDGGTRAELCGATLFRMLDLGWLVGGDGGRPERSDSGAT